VTRGGSRDDSYVSCVLTDSYGISMLGESLVTRKVGTENTL